jgi:heterokaryon incompatibility protein (HET)
MALRRFRLEADARIIWADGICINQESVEERGNQVSFMDEIYARGSHTLIWLGEVEDIKVSDAFQLIKEINGYMDSELKALNKSDKENIYDLIRRIPPATGEHVSLFRPER